MAFIDYKERKHKVCLKIPTVKKTKELD